MTHKFKVGDRVQFVAGNKHRLGAIVSEKNKNSYIVKDDHDTYIIHKNRVAPAPALIFVPQWFDDAYKEVIEYNWNEYAQKALLHFIARTGFGNQFSIVESDGTQQYCEGATDYVRDNRFDLIRAVLDGYEVEKEPLYRVPLTDEGRDGLLVALSYDDEMDDSYEVKCVLSQVFSEENFYKLTEKQIRAYDERYWQFAVPVEEVSE
ncbi:DUF1642 domain-containing protein [Listeria booriae]|uniref:DUF1642 domain-containing protein n=1 Tax=Listeria booriae TaxID=1552123 RepID=A0A842AEV8_9LIST|nr:DUF1642 domain-containing protein [Listeria booriae]MBC1615404.1 DUF1642 domain-containing protein [Listeria booriae]